MPNCKRVFYLIFSHKNVSITYTNYSLWQNTKFSSCFTGSFCLLYEFNVLMPAIFILAIALLTKDGQFLVSRTSSPLADLYSTSTLEHHHFDQCIMILSTKVSDAQAKKRYRYTDYDTEMFFLSYILTWPWNRYCYLWFNYYQIPVILVIIYL